MSVDDNNKGEVMQKGEPAFTLGVEEEYLLVDKETRALVVDPPETLMQEAEEKCGSQVTSELLRSQIEIGTTVCKNVKEAREELRGVCTAKWEAEFVIMGLLD